MQKQGHPGVANPNVVQTTAQELKRLHHDSPSRYYLNVVQTDAQDLIAQITILPLDHPNFLVIWSVFILKYIT